MLDVFEAAVVAGKPGMMTGWTIQKPYGGNQKDQIDIHVPENQVEAARKTLLQLGFKMNLNTTANLPQIPGESVMVFTGNLFAACDRKLPADATPDALSLKTKLMEKRAASRTPKPVEAAPRRRAYGG